VNQQAEQAGVQARYAPWFVRFKQPARGRPELSLQRLDDLADPLSSTATAGSVHAVFRGRLDGRKELKTRLGVGDADTSDAEIILRAYSRWGRELLRQLRGVFAFFIWDGERDCLVFARDPLGIEPLFYARAGEDFLFAPTPTTLLEQPGVSKLPNRAVLAELILRRWLVYDETYDAAVRRVRLGHVLTITNGTVSTWRVWHPLFDLRDHGWVQPDELEAFDGLLETAVARCLDVGPTGILLSGGFDSVSVAAVAADLARKGSYPTPLALSLLFPTPETSEEEVQVGVARALAMPQIALDLLESVAPDGIVLRALDLNESWPWPLNFLWAPAYRELVRAGARQGVRVILTGDGGDEWLATDRSAAADLIAALELRSLYEFVQAKRRSYEWPRWSVLRLILWRSGLRPILRFHTLALLRQHSPEALRAMRLRRRSRRHAEEMPDWLAPDRELRVELRQRYLDARSTADKEVEQEDFGSGFRYYLSEGVSVDDPLASADQEDAYERGKRSGVEYLHPYLEPDLISFLYRVPPGLLMQGGREKGLVRRSIAQRFPDLGFERQKKVMGTNFHYAALRREGPEAWRRVGACDALVELGIVRRDRYGPLVQENLASPELRAVQRAWDLIKLESWLRPRLAVS
jgi:asparagine synthase (glutamine-hydrolysing)